VATNDLQEEGNTMMRQLLLIVALATLAVSGCASKPTVQTRQANRSSWVWPSAVAQRAALRTSA
jgi:hypothetical protein